MFPALSASALYTMVYVFSFVVSTPESFKDTVPLYERINDATVAVESSTYPLNDSGV